MSKTDFQKMAKELRPIDCYKNLIEMETHLKELAELNSLFNLNGVDLITKASHMINEDQHRHLKKDTNFDKQFGSLQSFAQKKLDKIKELKKNLELIEKESVLQSEMLAQYQMSINEELKK